MWRSLLIGNYLWAGMGLSGVFSIDREILICRMRHTIVARASPRLCRINIFFEEEWSSTPRNSLKSDSYSCKLLSKAVKHCLHLPTLLQMQIKQEQDYLQGLLPPAPTPRLAALSNSISHRSISANLFLARTSSSLTSPRSLLFFGATVSTLVSPVPSRLPLSTSLEFKVVNGEDEEAFSLSEAALARP